MQTSPEVQRALSLAANEATKRRHASVAVPHLLLALLSDPVSANALRHAGGDLAALEAQLAGYLDHEIAQHSAPTEPTLSPGVERVLHRAGLHVQATSKGEVLGTNLLIALFAERDSPAITLLEHHGVTRFHLISYLTHGISRAPDAPAPRSSRRQVQ
jgi:ATP-dependent Clp protease ATP-binding subunit ClpA